MDKTIDNIRFYHGRFAALALLSGCATFFCACSTTEYAKRADKDAYGIVAEKSDAVPGMDADFSIEQDKSQDPLVELPKLETLNPALGDAAETEKDAAVLSLERALWLSVNNSRTYQARKETVYLEALGLSLDRHRYTPIFSGGASGEHVWSARDITDSSSLAQFVNSTNGLAAALEGLTGTPATLLQSYADVVEGFGAVSGLDAPVTDIERERSIDGGTSVGVNMLMQGGARIALNLSSNFLRFLTGDSRTATSSVLSGSLTQPLLRGAGKDINAETLTQAERDVLYSLREFTQFRKEFAVQIASDYYNVLLQKEVVNNNWASYNNFKQNLERERAFAVEGRRTLSQIGRLEQALLSTENQWIAAVRRYKERLDQFKISLGLPTDARVVLDDSELQRLSESGIVNLNISPEDATLVAESARLDLYTIRDRVDDAERKVKVAANALKPGLDLILTGSSRSTGADNFQELDFDRATYSAGLDVDLPFDRKAERNAYRAALIAFEKAARDYSLEADNVKLQIRSAYRNLEEARRNYEVAQQSVALNQRRVEEQNLLAELGRATALDQVDAQNALTQAQNDLISALVTHTVTRLAFWRDMGILYVKPDGQWEMVEDGGNLPPVKENGDA